MGQIIALDDNEVLYHSASYVDAPAWYRFSPDTMATTETALAVASPVDFSDCEVVREYALSQGRYAGPRQHHPPQGHTSERFATRCYLPDMVGLESVPCLPSPPYIASGLSRAVSLRKPIFAVAGSMASNGTETACSPRSRTSLMTLRTAMHHMIDAGYTRPEKMAIIGGSNGGLLMGAMITQHPDLCRAVVSFVGIYDMLRVELAPQRPVQRSGVRHGKRAGPVPRPVCVFSLSQRQDGDRISGRSSSDGCERPPVSIPCTPGR